MLLVKNAPGGGASFFLTLEAELVRAHDANRINETALLELLQIINLGQPVTFVDLARVFGVDVVFGVVHELRPEPEDPAYLRAIGDCGQRR